MLEKYAEMVMGEVKVIKGGGNFRGYIPREFSPEGEQAPAGNQGHARSCPRYKGSTATVRVSQHWSGLSMQVSDFTQHGC
jgi:hypothetical protein